jgi:hypothetical protein
MTKIRCYTGFWTKSIVKNRENVLFIFGDNDVQKGAGGQAVIRGLPNAIGVPTKKYPNNNKSSFYTDVEYSDNKKKISRSINKIISESKKYKYVVLPSSGLGTGLANLPKCAPRTFKYLLRKIEELKETI